MTENAAILPALLSAFYDDLRGSMTMAKQKSIWNSTLEEVWRGDWLRQGRAPNKPWYRKSLRDIQRERQAASDEEASMFEPDQYGALVVVVAADTEKIPVHASSEADSETELHVYPIKQNDGTGLAHFPVVPAGNWRVRMIYSRGEKKYSWSQVVTIFPGHLSKLVFSE